jgi:predicted nucleic acid-binding protein
VIILDTNVISELMKASPSVRVARWLAAQASPQVFITSITEAEVLYGVELLPPGKKREALRNAATAMFAERFGDRTLAFDRDAAGLFAAIGTARRRAGRPIGQFDCQIAAIARWHGAAIATRDSRDFADCGVDVINPWA